MPLTAKQVEALSDEVARLYGEAERILLERIARALARDLDAPEWAERKLIEVQLLLARIRGDLNTLAGQSAQEVARGLLTAYNRGQAAALADMVLADLAMSITSGANPATLTMVQRLIGETVGDLLGSHQRILRSVDDVYRQVVREASAQQLLGVQTRREATQAALNRWADRGVTGFVDRAGRQWDMKSYAEMSMRTAARRASVEGHTDRLLAQGQDLVFVSDHSQECSLCLVPGTVVEGPIPTGRTRTEYTGDVVRIVTAAGNDLTGTPDHPVLTSRGWVALKDLRPGDQVVSHDRQQGHPGVMPDHVQVPTLIEEAGESWLPLLTAGPSRRDLDKDVAYRKVGGPAVNLYLAAELNAALGKPVTDHLFVDRVGATDGGLALGGSDLVLLGSGLAAGGMRGFKHGGSLLGGGPSPSLAHGLARGLGSLLVVESSLIGDDRMGTRPSLHSSAAQVVADYPAADAEGGAELLRGLAGCVALDEVLSISVRQFSGHVWDLSTEPSWYVANGIVTHNCRPWEGKILSLSGAPRVDGVEVSGTLDQARAAGFMHPGCRHTIGAYLPGFTKVPKDTADPEGDAARQQLRYLERQVRAWKRREMVALDDQARAKARAKVRVWQARIRAHVEATGAKRQPFREQVGAAR